MWFPFGISTCAMLPMVVRPPWYIAGSMILIYVLGLIALLVAVLIYYIRKSRRVQERLHCREKERREKGLGLNDSIGAILK